LQRRELYEFCMPTLPPLLLTSCVTASAKMTQVIDQTLRIELTIKSIEKWLTIAGDLKIVICDGSNYNFTPLMRRTFTGKAIECLNFNNNSKGVALYGKGYGEGEIINYALEHSMFLNNAEYFAKCTSKLWVDNFLECLQYWNNTFLSDCDFSYLKNRQLIKLKSIDTAFYLVNKLYYKDNFSSAYLNVREEERHWLEHCFRDIIIQKKLKKFMLPVAPIVRGVSGTRGSENRYSLLDKANDKIKRFFVKKSKLYVDFIAENPDFNKF